MLEGCMLLLLLEKPRTHNRLCRCSLVPLTPPPSPPLPTISLSSSSFLGHAFLTRRCHDFRTMASIYMSHLYTLVHTHGTYIAMYMYIWHIYLYAGPIHRRAETVRERPRERSLLGSETFLSPSYILYVFFFAIYVFATAAYIYRSVYRTVCAGK